MIHNVRFEFLQDFDCGGKSIECMTFDLESLQDIFPSGVISEKTCKGHSQEYALCDCGFKQLITPYKPHKWNGMPQAGGISFGDAHNCYNFRYEWIETKHILEATQAELTALQKQVENLMINQKLHRIN